MNKGTISYDDRIYDAEDIIQYYNDEIREELHSILAPTTEQKFFDEYLKRDPDFMERFKYDLYPMN